jgi:hypothetical protein
MQKVDGILDNQYFFIHNNFSFFKNINWIILLFDKLNYYFIDINFFDFSLTIINLKIDINF